MQGVYVKDMKMPKDCPMCPMAHWNAFNMISGCEAVPGKKYAIRDPEYANSDTRPDWCPLVNIPPHGDLIDRDEFVKGQCNHCDGACEAMPCNCLICRDECRCDMILDLMDAPVILPAEEGET